MPGEKEFLQLIADNQGIIHKVCNMYAAAFHEREDLFQEVMLNAWKGFANFRGDAKFSTWLYRVALNTAITNFKKTSKDKSLAGIPLESLSFADSVNSNEEQFQAMHHAINNLTKIDKALVLLHLEGYDHNEIGEMLGISANNVAVKHHRIKTKLRETTIRILNV